MIQFFSECWFSLSKTTEILIILIILLIYIMLFGSFSTIVGIFLSMWLGFKVAALMTDQEEATPRNFQRWSNEDKNQVLDALHEDPSRTHRIVSEILGIPKSTVTDIMKRSIAKADGYIS